MQVTIGKAEHLADGYKENMDLAGEEASKTGSAKTNNAAVSAKLIEKSKNMPYSRQCNPSTSIVLTTLDSSRNSTASVKPKSSGNTKKSSRTSSSFFDRYFLVCRYFLGLKILCFFNNHFTKSRMKNRFIDWNNPLAYAITIKTWKNCCFLSYLKNVLVATATPMIFVIENAFAHSETLFSSIQEAWSLIQIQMICFLVC